MRAGRQNNGAGLVNVPFALVPFVADNSAAVGAPTMANDIQAEDGRSTKIGFKCQRLFLLVQAAEDPVNRQGTRTELQGNAGIFKASGRKLKASMKAGAVEPTKVEDAAFAGAGGLNPAKSFGAATSVVRREKDIPHR